MEKEGIQAIIKVDRIGESNGDEGAGGATKAAGKTLKVRGSKATESKASIEEGAPSTNGRKRKAAKMEEQYEGVKTENLATTGNENPMEMKTEHQEIMKED